ncbi:hypothetical protein, partial [Klebsiella pneumoniae]
MAHSPGVGVSLKPWRRGFKEASMLGFTLRRKPMSYYKADTVREAANGNWLFILA